MFSPEDSGPIADSEWISATDLASMYEKKGFILLQNTGMFDKNEKEIFEGDIVKIENAIIGGVYFVRYKAPGFDLRDENISVSWGQECYRDIVGNIFENPELLKLEKTVEKK